MFFNISAGSVIKFRSSNRGQKILPRHFRIFINPYSKENGGPLRWSTWWCGLYSYLDRVTIFLNLIKCITACGITPFRVYFHMREFTFPRPFPHVEIPPKSCIPARFFPRKFTNPLVNWHAETHFPARISACGNTPKNEYFRTLGNPQFLVYFNVRKCTISCEFLHWEKRISAGADLHILLCISTCGNSLKTMKIRVRGNTLFLMWEFILNCVSPHAVIHQNLCKSAQRIYTFSGAFPQVEIHNYKCIFSYAENRILVNFLVFGNSHFLVYIRMR